MQIRIPHGAAFHVKRKEYLRAWVHDDWTQSRLGVLFLAVVILGCNYPLPVGRPVANCLARDLDRAIFVLEYERPDIRPPKAAESAGA